MRNCGLFTLTNDKHLYVCEKKSTDERVSMCTWRKSLLPDHCQKENVCENPCKDIFLSRCCLKIHFNVFPFLSLFEEIVGRWNSDWNSRKGESREKFFILIQTQANPFLSRNSALSKEKVERSSSSWSKRRQTHYHHETAHQARRKQREVLHFDPNASS